MKISLLQMDLVLGSLARNREKAERMIDEAMQSAPDVIVLPELWNTGFFPEDVASYADKDGIDTVRLLRIWAKKYTVNIVGGSVAILENGKPVNTNYVVDRQGEVISRYDKLHLFSPSGEDRVFSAGKEIRTFLLDGVKSAVVICYDLRFCELIRLLALEGIELLFIPAAWPHPRLAHWQTLVRARAIENQLFVAAVNGAGSAGKLDFCGGSMVVDPWGEALAEAEEAEQIVTCEIDLAVVRDIRERINVFRDRRADLYALSVK